MSQLGDLPAAATTQGAGQTVDQAQGRTFPCESCGADLEFHIGQQTLRCPFCGFTKDFFSGDSSGEERVAENPLEETLQRLVELRRGGDSDVAATQVMECSYCRAKVEFTGTLTSTRCAFCGSPVQRENIHRSERLVPVDGMVPFKIERRRAQQHLRRWLKALWFAPNDFKKAGIRGEFEGVYLPFWTYDAMTYSRYRGERGEHYYTGSGKNRKRQTRWSSASGQFQRFFDDVMVAAGTHLPRGWVEKLEPWPLADCVPFREELLAGYLSQSYDVQLDQGFGEAKQRMDRELRQETQQRIGGDVQRIHQLDSDFSALTYKHLLLPVWSLGYRYGGKSYQVVINATTGEVQGQRPYSAIKIALFVLFILALLVLFFWARG